MGSKRIFFEFILALFLAGALLFYFQFPAFRAQSSSDGPSLLLRAVISVELLDMRRVVRSARVGPPDYMAGRLTFRALRISC